MPSASFTSSKSYVRRSRRKGVNRIALPSRTTSGKYVGKLIVTLLLLSSYAGCFHGLRVCGSCTENCLHLLAVLFIGGPFSAKICFPIECFAVISCPLHSTLIFQWLSIAFLWHFHCVPCKICNFM